MTDDAAQRRRLRWGSLALFVGAPVLLLGWTVLNLLDAADREAAASRQEAVLGAIERRAGAGQAVGGDTSAAFLQAGSDALAKAELQQLLVRLVAQSSGRLIETQGGDEPTEADDRRVQVRVTLDATHDGLFDLLHGIETGSPLLSVEQVDLRQLADPSGGESADTTLRVSLVVAGHWKGKGE